MKRLFVCLAAMAVYSGSSLAQIRWDMATPYRAGDLRTENVMQFVADIEKHSNGGLKVTVHADGSLVKPPEIKSAVQSGKAQIGQFLLAAYSKEDPIFTLDIIPFLATSFDDAAKLWKSSRRALDQRFAKQGMKVLYSVPWPPQGIYSDKAIDSIAEMRDRKMRAYNPTTSRLVELLGARPVTLKSSELKPALASGGLNMNITSGASGYEAKTWEQVGFFYDIQVWLPKNVVVVNQSAFDALDKATQDAVMKAAAQAETMGWKISEEKTKWYVEQLARNGMQVSAPSPRLKAELMKIGETMTAEWIGAVGEEGRTIIEAYRK